MTAESPTAEHPCGAIVWALSLLAITFLHGCGSPKEVIASPGMDVSEFNRLNAGTAQPMKLSGSDWIGINSPVTLVFEEGGQSIRFTGTRSSGGIQVASSDLAIFGAQPGHSKVHTIAFNLDGGMEEIEAKQRLLSEKCAQLARMARLPPKPVPDTHTLRERLKHANGSMVEVCSGEGPVFTFSITATHYDGHWRHGGNYSWAYFDGSLGAPLKPEDETLETSSSAAGS